MTDTIVKEEALRVHAQPTKSDFEMSIFSDIMIWGYERNMELFEQGKPMIKHPSMKELAEEYWALKLS